MNEIKNISTYRTPIMGISIIWVILYHIGLEYEFTNPIIGKIASLGYGGVDFFIFLSGFGLYYSYLKNNNVGNFYYKRFRRIVPEFILVTIILSIVSGNFSITETLMKVTTIGFWLPQFNIPYHLWYVSAIILFYLVFPLYMYFFYKNPKLSLMIGCVIGLVLSLIYAYTYLILYPTEKCGLIFFTSRIPLFCIGIYFGKLSKTSTIISKRFIVGVIWLAILFTIVLLLLTKYTDYWILRNGGLYYYPFIFIVPGACLAINYILKRIPYISRLLSSFGKISFELYLVHEGLISCTKVIVNNMEFSMFYTTILIFIVSIIFAYVIYYINKVFFTYIFKEHY